MFRSVRIALMVSAVAAALAIPAFAGDDQGGDKGGDKGKGGEPIPGPVTPGKPVDPCGPTMQTIAVTECVPETYKVKRIVYKQVCKPETYTAYKCESFPVTKTRTVTTYTKKAVWKDVCKTVYDKVQVCEERTVMKAHWTTKQVTEMQSRKVDKGHWVCEEVPAPFKNFCQRLGSGHGHRKGCNDPCADPCANTCQPQATRTVKRWHSCWVTECCPVTVCKRVCEMRPEVCKVNVWKCVPKTVTCKVCEYVCEPCTRTETYTCCETRQVPYTCTRNVVTCVPCEEEVTCTRLVAKTVYRQVPVSNFGTGNGCCDQSYSCCSSGGGHRLFSNFRGGHFRGHKSCGGCNSGCH